MDRITKVTLEDEIAKISHKNVVFTKIDLFCLIQLTELIGKEEERKSLAKFNKNSTLLKEDNFYLRDLLGILLKKYSSLIRL